MTTPISYAIAAHETYKQTAAERDRLKALCDELTEALSRIAYEPLGPAEATAETVLCECTDIARTALAKAKESAQ